MATRELCGHMSVPCWTPVGLSEYLVKTSISWFFPSWVNSFYSATALKKSQYILCVPVNYNVSMKLRFSKPDSLGYFELGSVICNLKTQAFQKYEAYH
jgi:hypothetical protein